MKLIAGLGNPGLAYHHTYHNIGFMAVDRLVKELDHKLPLAHKFDSLFVKGRLENNEYGLLKPQTFMNLSGSAVAKALRFFKISESELMVVYDDIDLPLGKLRYRTKGGHGGHNGMRDIILKLSSNSFQRLKIGVGRGDGTSAKGHVLKKITPIDQARLDETLDQAATVMKNFILALPIQIKPEA